MGMTPKHVHIAHVLVSEGVHMFWCQQAICALKPDLELFRGQTLTRKTDASSS